MRPPIETRGPAESRQGGGPFALLAAQTRLSESFIADRAAAGELRSIIDKLPRRLTPHECVIAIQARRWPAESAAGRKSPHALLGELRARKTIWAAELAEERRSRCPHGPLYFLEEIRARQIPSWWGE